MNGAKLVDLSDLINSKKIRRIGVTPYFISKDERLSFLLYLKENRNLIFDFGGCPRSFEKDIFSYLRRNLNDYFGSYRLKGEDIFGIFEDVLKKSPQKVKIWMIQSNDSEYYQIFFPLQQRYELDNFCSDSEIHKLIWVSSREFLIRKNISIPIFTKFWRSEMISFLSSFFSQSEQRSPTDIGDILSSIPTDLDSSSLEITSSPVVENNEGQSSYPLPSDYQGLTPHLEERTDFEKAGIQLIFKDKECQNTIGSQISPTVPVSPIIDFVLSKADFPPLRVELSPGSNLSSHSPRSSFSQYPPGTNPLPYSPRNNFPQYPPGTNPLPYSPRNNFPYPPGTNPLPYSPRSNFAHPSGNNFPPHPSGNNFPPHPSGNNFPHPSGNNFPHFPSGNNFPHYPSGNNFPPHLSRKDFIPKSHFVSGAQNILDYESKSPHLSLNKKLFSRYFVKPVVSNPHSEHFSLFSRSPEQLLGIVDSSYFSNPFF